MTQPLERLYSFNYSSLCARKHPLQIDFSRSNNKWFWSWSKVASFLYFSRLFFHTDWTSFCGFPLEWNCQWQDQPVYDSFIELGTLPRQHCYDIQITISSSGNIAPATLPWYSNNHLVLGTAGAFDADSLPGCAQSASCQDRHHYQSQPPCHWACGWSITKHFLYSLLNVVIDMLFGCGQV